jgi:hypothetical protein
LAAALGGLAVVLALSGCGGTTSVSGKVTHDGKPVVWGGVTLVDSTGTYHQGDIKPNGTYQIDNVPTGPVKIGVTSPKPPEEKPGRGGKTAPGGNAAAGGGKGPAGQPEDPREKFLRDQGITPNQPPPPPPPGAWFALPEKARDPMTSGLTGTVAAGKPLDIDVPK